MMGRAHKHTRARGPSCLAVPSCRCPVHITEGNGGVPGVPGNVSMVACSDKAPWCRVHGTGGNYGRLTFFNASVFQYEHVSNNGGTITDSFVV